LPCEISLATGRTVMKRVCRHTNLEALRAYTRARDEYADWLLRFRLANDIVTVVPVRFIQLNGLR